MLVTTKIVIMPGTVSLARQRQSDLCEIQANLVYMMNSRAARATQQNPVSNKQNKPPKR